MPGAIAAVCSQKVSPLAYGPKIWLDGNDPLGTGVQPTNGASVSTWTDKSGFQNHFTQSGATRPTFTSSGLNSKGVLSFSGSQYMNASTAVINTIQYTMFVVGKTTTTASQQCFFSNGSAGTNGQSMMAITNPNKKFGMLYGGSTWVEDTGTATDTSYHIFSSVWNGSATTFSIGNVSQTLTGGTTAPITPTATSTVGASASSINGNIAEIIFYNKALSTAEITDVYNYLYAKWVFSGPLSYSPIIWLDAADPAGNVSQPNTGTTLATWTDKSGTSNTATASGTAQPTFNTNQINGLPTVSFNGTTNSMTISNVLQQFSANGTFFVVASAPATSTGSMFGTTSDGAASRISLAVPYAISSGDYIYDFGGNSGSAGRLGPSTWTGSLNTYYIYTFQTNSVSTNMTIAVGNSVLYTGAGSARTVSASASGTVGSFNGSFWSGSIGEMIIFNTALSTAQQTDIYTYLHKKWNV